MVMNGGCGSVGVGAVVGVAADGEDGVVVNLVINSVCVV